MIPRFRFALAAAAAAAALGIAAPATSRAAAPAGAHHDLDAARASLLAADAAHADATSSRGVDGWAAALATDVLYVPPDASPILEGREAARAWFDSSVPAGTTLSWYAVHGDVSGDASRGYTLGWRQAARPRPDGTIRVLHGMYASFWRRQGDRWVVIAHGHTGWYPYPLPPPDGWEFLPNDGALASEVEIDEAAGLAELLGADLAFSDLSVATHTGIAFGTYAAEDAVLLPGLHGPEAIAEAYTPPPGAPPRTMSWAPLTGGIAQSGDLGFTVGYGLITFQDPAAPPRHSKYLTVWKLRPEGWRFALDVGGGAPPPGDR